MRILETLELKPLKKKKLVVLMVEKEYNEPYWLIEPPEKRKNNLSTLQKPSIALISFLEKLVKKIKPDFATEELGLRSLEDFKEKNELSKFFIENNISFHPADIDERTYFVNTKNVEAHDGDKIILYVNGTATATTSIDTTGTFFGFEFYELIRAG